MDESPTRNKSVNMVLSSDGIDKSKRPHYVTVNTAADKCVIYDVTSNQLLEVSPLLEKWLASLPWDEETPPKALVEALGKSETRAAADEAGELFSRGHLRPIPIGRLKYVFNEAVFMDIADAGQYRMQLEVTEQCNLRCRYCGYTGNTFGRSHGLKKMSVATAKKAVDWFLARSTHGNTRQPTSIAFYGGEPLLNLEVIEEAIKFATDDCGRNDIHWSLTTNGTKLSDEVWKRLIKLNVHVTVSLDGEGPIHDRYRVFESGAGTYDTITHNLEWCRSKYPNFYKENVNFNICIAPPCKLEAVRRFATAKNGLIATSAYYSVFWADIEGIPEFATKVYNLVKDEALLTDWWDEYIKLTCSEEANSPEELSDWVFLHALFRKQWTRLKVMGVPRMGEQKEQYINLPCQPGLDKLLVRVDGSFAMCEKCYADPTFEIGNVNDGIRLDRVRSCIDMLERMRPQQCAQCWALSFCSVCFAYMRPGSSQSMEENIAAKCEPIKRSAMNLLRLHAKSTKLYRTYSKALALGD